MRSLDRPQMKWFEWERLGCVIVSVFSFLLLLGLLGIYPEGAWKPALAWVLLCLSIAAHRRADALTEKKNSKHG